MNTFSSFQVYIRCAPRHHDLREDFEAICPLPLLQGRLPFLSSPVVLLDSSRELRISADEGASLSGTPFGVVRRMEAGLRAPSIFLKVLC